MAHVGTTSKLNPSCAGAFWLLFKPQVPTNQDYLEHGGLTLTLIFISICVSLFTNNQWSVEFPELKKKNLETISSLPTEGEDKAKMLSGWPEKDGGCGFWAVGGTIAWEISPREALRTRKPACLSLTPSRSEKEASRERTGTSSIGRPGILSSHQTRSPPCRRQTFPPPPPQSPREHLGF